MKVEWTDHVPTSRSYARVVLLFYKRHPNLMSLLLFQTSITRVPRARILTPVAPRPYEIKLTPAFPDGAP